MTKLSPQKPSQPYGTNLVPEGHGHNTMACISSFGYLVLGTVVVENDPWSGDISCPRPLVGSGPNSLQG